MTDLRQEHGRLMARVRRQVEKAERLGATDERCVKILRTIKALIVTERLLDMDELQRATVQASAQRLGVLAGSVSDDDMRRRLMMLTPGAGLVIPRW